MPAVVVKVMSGTLAARVEDPLASRVWEPEGDAGTTKVALQPPWALAVIPEATVDPSYVIVIPVSFAAKPEPVTVIEFPGAPLALLTEMPEVIVKVKSGTLVAMVEGPLASMVWEPADDAGITNVVLQAPWEVAEIPEATDVPS
jgi:hypothetical protein